MRGTIDKREGKTVVAYRVRVELPNDPMTGKRRYRAETYKTRKEAEKRLREWVTEIENGIAVDTTKMNFADLCRQWLTVRRPDLKVRAYEHYEHTLMAHVVPLIGALPIQHVRAVTIDALYASLRDRGCSDHTVHRCHQRLRQVFDYAVKRHILAVNPMHAIDTPRMRSSPPTVLTAPQIGRFLAFAGNDGYSPLWLLLVQTGLRRGEALGVRWQDIDLDTGKLRVRQCVESWRGKPHIQTPKSKAALRTITLFPESVAALRAHRTKQLERRLLATAWEDNDLVFCTGEGKPIAPTHALRSLRTIRARANAAVEDEAERLPDFNIHDLRHTHATHLLVEGWPVPTVSRRLGHANPGITMTIYAHALSDVRDDEVVTPKAFRLTGTA
jgi:integrase